MFVPLILVDYPPPDVFRRRFGIAVAAGILASLFTGFAAQFPGQLVGASAWQMDMTDSQPAFVLAAATGTILYLAGNLLFEKPSAARSARAAR